LSGPWKNDLDPLYCKI